MSYAARMHCPFCSHPDTRVVDSRPADSGTSIRRRRECEQASCGRRFTTYERSEARQMVRKRGGEMEPFQIDKLERGLRSALADRPVASGDIETLVAKIHEKVRQRFPYVESDEIGREVLTELRATDEVAYLRYASVYKDFQGASDFETELAALEANPTEA